MAKGLFAYTPINRVPKNALIIVATIDGPKGLPATSSIFGLTTIIYDIVTRVVMPAITSCLILVASSSRLKKVQPLLNLL
jgi:hypothetical protein